jgi:hypothetical protein
VLSVEVLYACDEALRIIDEYESKGKTSPLALAYRPKLKRSPAKWSDSCSQRSIFEESGNMAKDKALMVDDDSAIRYTLTEAARAWGYDPLEASTVASASVSFKED